jgi:hypothetical protein
MNLNQIEYVIRQGAYALANQLDTHWPAEWSDDDTGGDQREANVLLHVGHALDRAGLVTFAEVPHARPGDDATRFDLVAASLADDTWLVLEAKRSLVHAGTVPSLARDFERVAGGWRGLAMIQQGACAAAFGAIIATTCEAELARWWTGEHPSERLDGLWTRPVASWTDRATSRWGRVGFGGDARRERLHLVYAIFSLR